MALVREELAAQFLAALLANPSPEAGLFTEDEPAETQKKLIDTAFIYADAFLDRCRRPNSPAIDKIGGHRSA